MQSSQPADQSTSHDADASDLPLPEQDDSKGSDDEDYHGDNSDDNAGSASASDDDTWNRVVTFADTPASRSSAHSHPAGDALLASAALARHSPRSSRRYPRAVRRVAVHQSNSEAVADASPAPYEQERPREFPGLAAATGNPNLPRSYTDLEALKQDLPSAHPSESPSANMHGIESSRELPDTAPHDQREAASVSYALDTPEPSPQPRASSSRLSADGHGNVEASSQKKLPFPSLPFSRGSQPHDLSPPTIQRRHTMQTHSSSRRSSKPNQTATTATTTTTNTAASSIRGNGRRNKAGVSSTTSSSSSELASPSQQDDSNSSGLERQWFKRANTFSVGDYVNQDTDMHRISSAKPHDTVHPLPRITTMTSAREKDGGDMETGIDDLPPLHFGREFTSGLRNIQLTFSEQPKQKQTGNPLKHLIRSKHNFRALVTYGGYLIPINILLNVILLGRGWLEYKVPDANGQRETVNNPLGYLVTSIVSLVLIVISGICFVLRCLEYDVLITTIMSVMANVANAVLILVSAVTYLKSERPAHPDANLTGEYYCSYAGAAVALLNALLLLIDILITPGFRYRGSGMSRQQRMLQFNIILIVVWIGIGGYAWSKIEAWDTITSVMFCMVTVTTIGFGNKSPTKTYSRALQLIYGPLGILMFGLMLLNTRNVIIQITRNKFRTAKREFQAKRKKLEEDVTANQVSRRLAARPVKPSWHSVVTDFLGRVFIPRRERVRAGIPEWLRRRLDRGERGTPDSHVDLEDGLKRPHDKDAGSLGTARYPGDAESTFSHAREPWDIPQQQQQPPMLGQRTASPDAISERAYSNRSAADDGSFGRGSYVEPPQHAIPRTYTTASRLSQVEEALSRPGMPDRIRRRMKFGLKHKHKHGASGRRHSDDQDSDDEAAFHSGGDTEDDNNNHGKDTGFKRVLTTASVIHNKVMDKASKGIAKAKNKAKKNGPRQITKQLWAALAINISFWCASAAIFYACESPEWTYFDALYFCYVAFTTIGYGDIVPATTEGMVTFICLCFVAVALETFLVVSAVTFFSEILSNTLRQTRVQTRIEKRRRGLVAYEIRRHVKQPDYNPFGTGDEDRMVNVGVSKLKKTFRHVREVVRGRRPVGDLVRLQRSADQMERDEQLTEGFIRHTTGAGGFAPGGWQAPSPLGSPTHRPVSNDLVPLSPSPSILSRASSRAADSPGAATLSPRAAVNQQGRSGSSDNVSVYSSTSLSPPKDK
ncbi:Potassium channel [Coemansia sp. RSA 1804]|nr:Potassium channel [Coemansia sp. RSA 1804]